MTLTSRKPPLLDCKAHLFRSLSWRDSPLGTRYPSSTASICEPQYCCSYIQPESDPYGLGDSYDEPPTPYHRFPLPPEPQSPSVLFVDRRRVRRSGLTGCPSEPQHVLQHEPRIPGEWLDDAARSVLSTVRGKQWTEQAEFGASDILRKNLQPSLGTMLTIT